MHPHVVVKRFIGARVAIGGGLRCARTILDAPQRTNGNAGRIHRHQQNRNPLVLGRVFVGSHHNINVRGGFRIRSVNFLPVDDVVVAITHRAALQRSKIGTAARLGEPLREHYLTANQLGDEVVLLLLGTRSHDRRRATAAQRYADIDPIQFLFHDILRDAVAALSAVFFRVTDAVPAAVGNFLEECAHMRCAAGGAVKRTALVMLLHLRVDFRSKFPGNKGAHFVPQILLLRCECKVHIKPPKCRSG